jgi:hypothetical protein
MEYNTQELGFYIFNTSSSQRASVTQFSSVIWGEDELIDHSAHHDSDQRSLWGVLVSPATG